MARRTAPVASVLGALLVLPLAACGSSEPAAASKAEPTVVLEGDQLAAMADQVTSMGIIEWHGQLLTKNPDNGGKRIFDLDGRYSPSTGYTALSMDSVIDGDQQQVDYLVVADRTYFNSEAWGPGSADCWVDITDDTAGRTWGLPTDLDPTWPVTSARAIRLAGDGVTVGIPGAAVLGGMPRGLFPTVPAAVDAVEATAVVTPHGPLIEVGVDVLNMWSEVPAEELAQIDTRKAGWWAMTMKESKDGSAIAPPVHVFDPAVTPPTQCKRA